MEINFFDSVHYDHRRSLTCSQKLLNIADSYFELPSSRKVSVLPNLSRNGALGTVEENFPVSVLSLVLRITSLFTLIVPLVFLIIKVISRRNHHFYLINPNEMATKIQSNFKCFLAKRNLKRLKLDKFISKNVVKKQNKAACSIQKIFIQFIEKTRDRNDKKYYSALCSATSSTSSCGSKHDNLLRVRKSLPENLASVPPFFGFTDSQIKACFTPQTQALWKEAQASTSWEQVKKVLLPLQESVKKDILSVKLFNSELSQTIRAFKEKRLIVRSSSNEDGSVVNAGGNKTLGNISATESTLKEAIADVVASYFSYRSLKNRAEFGKPFSSMPLCSVLIMEQVIDKEAQTRPVISGVMMTHKPNWGSSKEGRMTQISATYGFGEGVVTGKIPSDEWIVTDTTTYATIRNKNSRLKVLSGGESCEVKNDSLLQDKPVLEKAMLEKLGAVAKCLEESFKCHVDVEFVIENEKLYIVQARPIQAPPMTKTTYLDPETLPEKCVNFFAEPVVSGAGQVLSLKGEKILFASTLEEASLEFLSFRHSTVIVHTAPQASNSHAAVNFSSHLLPISCFALSKDKWEQCRALSKQNLHYHLCPQTGIVIVGEENVKLREGLFSHPASSPLSIGGDSKSIQVAEADKDTLEIEKLLSATPEMLEKRLDEVKAKITSVFNKVLSRIQTKKIKEITAAMQKSVLSTLEVMQKYHAGKTSHVALHAKMLKQMLHQVNVGVVSAHSLAGINAAITLPINLEVFAKQHCNNEILLDLAFFGQKAFDENLQKTWIAFLNTHLGSARLKELHEIMHGIDSINMIPLWFSFHFGEKSLPDIEALIKEGKAEFLHSCAGFDVRLQGMMQQLELVNSVDKFHSNWKLLLDFSHKFLDFVAKSKNRTSFETLYASRVSINLINLWDLHIKTVITSGLFLIEKKDLFCDLVSQFAKFGLGCYTSSLINSWTLKELMVELQDAPKKQVRGKFQGLEHWLLPRSECYGCIENDDQRLSVIHQNLLQAVQLNLSHSLLPSHLAKAVSIFQEHNDPDIVKRFAHSKGTFQSITEESALVKINVPLNLHSFVISLCQSKKSSSLKITAYWRGSDNWQGVHQDFLELFCTLTGITLESARNRNNDLEIVCSINNEQQMILLSRAIFAVNVMSLHSQNYYDELVYLTHPHKIEYEEINNKEVRETHYKIWDAIWQWFKIKKEMPNVVFNKLRSPSNFMIDYFLTRNLIEEIQTHVISELQGNANGTYIKNNFLTLLGKAVTKEEEILKIKKAISDRLAQRQKLYLIDIPKTWQQELYRRLCREAPKVALIYCKNSKYDTKNLKPFIEEMAKESPQSADAKELIDFALIASKE